MTETYAQILRDFMAARPGDDRIRRLEDAMQRMLEKLAAEEAARLARLAAAGVSP